MLLKLALWQGVHLHTVKDSEKIKTATVKSVIIFGGMVGIRTYAGPQATQTRNDLSEC